MAAEPTRRLLLATAGSLGLAGCLGGCKGITALGPIPKVAPDVVTLEHAIAAEEAMVSLYRQAIRLAGPSLTAHGARGGANDVGQVLATIRAEHEAHLRQLRARLILPARLEHTEIAALGNLPALPADQSGVLGTLAAQERDAAARLTSQLLTAPSALAQLLASISASEAAHVVYLRRAATT